MGERETAKHESASTDVDVERKEAEREEEPNTRFSAGGALPGVADKATDARQAQSASERAYNNDPKGAGVKMKTVYVDRAMRFSLDIDENSGRTFLSIPVQNKMVEYDEWYEVDKETFEKFKADPTQAHSMVKQAKAREIDHLLLYQPGKDRGIP